MSFAVRFSTGALAYLERLFEFLLDRTTSVEGLDLAERAIAAIRSAANDHLARTPFIFRKAGGSPLRRELVIPFGGSGYVALYEFEPALSRVVVLAVRHQLEDDCH